MEEVVILQETIYGFHIKNFNWHFQIWLWKASLSNGILGLEKFISDKHQDQ